MLDEIHRVPGIFPVLRGLIDRARRANRRHGLYLLLGSASLDLLLAFPGGRLWAVEIKRSLSPSLSRGFHSACADLTPERRFVVYSGETSFPVNAQTEAVPLTTLARPVAAPLS